MLAMLAIICNKNVSIPAKEYVYHDPSTLACQNNTFNFEQTNHRVTQQALLYNLKFPFKTKYY